MILKYKFVLMNIFLLILVMLQILFIKTWSVDELIYEFVAIDVYCIIIGLILFKDIMHPYMVFIYLFNMFLGSRIIINFLGGDSFAYTTFFTPYQFTESIQINMLMMCILALLSFAFGILISEYLFHNNEKKLVRNVEIIKFSIGCMILCVVPSVVYYYIRMKAVLEYGYGVGSIAVGIAYDSPLQYFANFLLFFYYVFLASKPSKKEFFIVTFFQVGVLILSMFGGERGTFALNISLMLVYYGMYIGKIDWKTILSLVISLIFVFEIINETRITQDYSNINLSAHDVVREFFVHQGVSLTVLGYADQYKDNGSCSDVLYPIYNFLGDHFIDDYRIKYKPNLDFAHKISLEANPVFYNDGHGTGSSYVAELYSSGGYIGVFVGSLIIGILMMLLIKKYSCTFYGCFVLLVVLKAFFWMPRGSYLTWLTEGARYTLYLYIIISMIELFKKKIKINHT